MLEEIAQLGPQKGIPVLDTVMKVVIGINDRDDGNIMAQIATFVIRYNNYGRRVVELARRKNISVFEAQELLNRNSKFWINGQLFDIDDLVNDLVTDELEDMLEEY